jgi:hypothetical protein
MDTTPARLTRFDPATAGGYWIKWSHPNKDSFFHVADVLKARVPFGSRQYDPVCKSWRVAEEYLIDLGGVLPEILVRLEAHRRAPTPRPFPPPWRERPAVPREVAEALDVLYLLPGVPRPLVQAAYRALALRHHPDVGGSTVAMADINRAYETIQQFYATQEPPTEQPQGAPTRRRGGTGAAA